MFAGEWNVLSRPNNKVVGPNGVLMGTEGGAGIISPTALDGLALWLDAIDQNSLLASDGSVIEDGEAVALWSDKSGNSAENVLLLPGVVSNYASFTALTAFGTGDFSVSARVNVSSLAAIGYTFAGSLNSFGLAINTSGKLVAIKLLTGALTESTGSISTFSDVVIGYTRSGTDGKYYINGVLDSTVTDNNDYTVGITEFGSRSGGTALPLTGKIKWARVYSAALDASAMAADAAGTQQANCVFDVDFRNSAKLATSATDSVGSKTVTINSTGATGARISGARDLYQGTVANRPVFLKYNGEKYGYLNGVSGNYFSTPDSAALDITGDIDISAKISLDDWTPAGIVAVSDKWLTTADNRSYGFSVDTTGALRFAWTTDGTSGTQVIVLSTAIPGFSDRSVQWIRATLDVNNGSGLYVLRFYTGGTGENPSWSQLGADLTGPATSIYSGNAPVSFGASSSGLAALATGTLRKLEIKDGIDGTLVASFNAQDYNSGSTFVSSATGETWTLNGGSHIVQRTGLYFDGSNDYLKSASFSLSQPENDYIIGSLVTWTSGDTLRGGVSTGFGTYQTGASPGLKIYAGTGVAANNTLELKTDGIITSIFNEASSSLRINRGTASTGNPGASNSNGITLCASEVPAAYANAFIHEVLIYDTTAQDTATQDRVALYAGKKWKFAV